MSITRIEPAREPRARGGVKRAPVATTPRAMEPASPGELPRLPPRRRESPWLRRALVFATCALMMDALFGERGLAETVRARASYEAARQDLARLRRENAALYEQARRLREDPSALEAIARAELGLARPGEILVVVKDVK